MPLDFKQAVLWSRKAAVQGESGGQALLGWLYSEGKGVPLDNQKAIEWCRKAAAQGDEDGRKLLDWMLKFSP